jgi:hypothetical protein
MKNLNRSFGSHKLFIVPVKVHSGEAMLNCSKVALAGFISHHDAPSRPVQVAGDQSFDYVFLEPRICFRIKLRWGLNFLPCHFLLNSKVRVFFHWVIYVAFVQEISHIVVHIIVGAVFVVDEEDVRFWEDVQVVEVIVAESDLFLGFLGVLLD